MSFVKDWATEAAAEVYRAILLRPHIIDANDIRKILVKHSPIPPDMAFMPVPRCDQCKHWTVHHSDTQIGYCTNGKGVVADQMVTDNDFGCVQWENKV